MNRVCTLLSPFVVCSLAMAQHFELARHRHMPAPLPNQRPVMAAAADLDLDGDLDLVMTNGGIEVIWNDGEGRFVRTGPPLTGSGPFGHMGPIAVGDIDGDGDADIVGAGYDFFGIVVPHVVLRNDGGAFTNVTAQQWVAVPWISSDIALFDFDGDTDLDIVTCNASRGHCGSGVFDPGSQPNRLYLNNGQGSFFGAPGRLPNPLAAWTGVATGDVDADGDTDLVFASATGCGWAPAGGLWLFRQNASGIAAHEPGALPTPPGSYTSVRMLDADNDGDLDVATTSSVGVQVFVNSGSGQFTAALAPPGLQVSSLAALDLDNDGRIDLLGARAPTLQGSEPGPMSYWRNTPAVFVDETALAVDDAALAPAALHVFDADGDGDLDVWGAAEPQPYLWWNDGQGHLRQTCATDLGADYLDSSDAPSFAFADIDGDGDLDATIIRPQGTQRRVLLIENDGMSLGPAARLLPPAAAATAGAVSCIDFDHDGDLDVHVGNGCCSSLAAMQDRMFRNDGWTFVDVTASALPIDMADDRQAAVGDIDGDGNDDLVLGALGLRLLRGTGAGTFVEATGTLPAGNVQCTGVGLIDFDHDGDRDIVWTASPSLPGAVHILRNDWPAPFVDVGPSLVPVNSASSLALLDVDADTWTDLVVSTGAGLQLFRNVAGTFVDETAARLPPTAGSLHVRAGDLDGNGHVDLIVRLLPNDSYDVLRNTAGVFALAPNLVPPGTLRENLPAIGDVDRDGDPDYLSSGGVVRSRLRHLVNAVPPRLGRRGSLVLQAHAGDGTNVQLGLLFLAPQLAVLPVVLPAAGVVFLDVATSALHSVHVLLPTGGEAEVGYIVPPDPTLLGAPLFAQAAFLHTFPASGALHLSNYARLEARL
jgi:hypothetical protein